MAIGAAHRASARDRTMNKIEKLRYAVEPISNAGEVIAARTIFDQPSAGSLGHRPCDRFDGAGLVVSSLASASNPTELA
jgi:hypothetical protein